MQIGLNSKVTRIHKATTAENDTSLCSLFWFCFLNFIPVERAEISHMNRQNKIHPGDRLPGSYEEGLRQ